MTMTLTHSKVHVDFGDSSEHFIVSRTHLYTIRSFCKQLCNGLGCAVFLYLCFLVDRWIGFYEFIFYANLITAFPYLLLLLLNPPLLFWFVEAIKDEDVTEPINERN